MTRRTRLSIKILLTALLNVALLLVLFLLFARVQFQFNLSSFLLEPAKATIASVSRLIALELPNAPRSAWDNLLAQYSSRYPAQLYLFNSRAEQLAGPRFTLPNDFAHAVCRDPFSGSPNGLPGRGAPPPGPPPAPPGDMPHAPGPERRPGRLTESALIFSRTGTPAYYWVGVRAPVWLPGGKEPIHGTLVWRIRSIWTERVFFEYRPWLIVVLAILATVIVCWLPLIRDLTAAIRRLTVATRQIADGSFTVDLPTSRRDELGSLSESIRTMAQRLSGYVHGQKRFLGDIAHELSSPVARIQVGLGILEQRLTTGEDSAHLADVREDVEHMSSLISDLLAFSKSQAIRTNINRVPVSIAPLIASVLQLEDAQSIVAQNGVQTCPAVLAVPELLERAIANVVRNALQYASDAGPVNLSVTHDDGVLSIAIADSGPGLPESELENVFRPFYRPEFARQRETGGTGLGLAIVRDCIESCGGTVFCRNRVPHGLEVVILLRAAAI